MLDNGFPQVLIKAWFMKIVTVPSFSGIQAWSRLEGRAKQKKGCAQKISSQWLTPTFRFVLWMRSDERQALLWEELNGLTVTRNF